MTDTPPALHLAAMGFIKGREGGGTAFAGTDQIPFAQSIADTNDHAALIGD